MIIRKILAHPMSFPRNHKSYPILVCCGVFVEESTGLLILTCNEEEASVGNVANLSVHVATTRDRDKP